MGTNDQVLLEFKSPDELLSMLGSKRVSSELLPLIENELRARGVALPPRPGGSGFQGTASGVQSPQNAKARATGTQMLVGAIPRYELKLPDSTLRQITGAEDVRDELVDGRLPGDTPCRPIAKPGKGGVLKEATSGTAASIIGRSGFQGRVLFRPVWAHTVSGLGIGVVTGFAAWLLLDVFIAMSTALQLSGQQYNGQN